MLLEEERFDSETHQAVQDPKWTLSASLGSPDLPSYHSFSSHLHISLHVRVWGAERAKE